MAECANPLLLGWVSEWLKAAEEHNSKGVTVYRKAYNSLKSCPLPFNHPSEAQQLHGFGPKLCDRLTAKLKEYCEENGLPMPRPTGGKKKAARNGEDDGDEDDDAPAPAKKTRKPKAYVPTLRSGGYALILALATLNQNAPIGLTKTQVIELAQPHCDSSFTAPSHANKFYTAWNSMKTLIDKDLVDERGRPTKRYSLTEEGWEVAKRIKNTADSSQRRLNDFAGNRRSPKGKEQTNDFMDLSSSPTRTGSRASRSPEESTDPDIVPQGNSSAPPTFTPITLPPGTFEIQLIIDNREVRAQTDRDYIRNELSKKGITPVVRSIILGDVLWVAKVSNPSLLSTLGAEGDEVLLDWIIERKRLDDLVSSIKEGRYHEQKFRLQKSGLKNVIYIIEDFNGGTNIEKYGEAIQSAIAGTQVVNGFFIKRTQLLDDTIRYLARMTVMLKGLYENKPLHVIPTNVITSQNYMPLLDHLREKEPAKDYHITYDAFASLSSKSGSLTLRDVYLKMLMCTRAVTGEKALEIQRRWKTPSEFVEAYEKCGTGDDGRKRKLELVSGEMGNLVGRKKIAKALSMKIAEIWGYDDY